MAPKRKANRTSQKTSEKSTVWVPEDFDFDEVFRKVLFTQKTRETLKNASYFVLHSLSRHKYSQYYLEKIEETGYYGLSAELLKRVCGSKYRLVLDTLKEARIIEEDPSGYEVGVRHRGFRLTLAWERSTSVPRELDGEVRKRYQKHADEEEKKNQVSLASIRHLTKWFDSSELTIDVKGAHNFIELAYIRIKMLLFESELSPTVKAELQGRILLRLNYQIASVKAFESGEYQLSNKGRDERLHSILTSMKRELRSFIQYKGQYLSSLDIMSSQPYLFTMLLRKGFYSTSVRNPLGWKSVTTGFQSKNERTGTKVTPLSPPHSQLPAPTLISTMFPGCKHLTEHQTLERSLFCNISWPEDFYTLLAKELQARIPRLVSREATKKFVMWLFFEHRSYKDKDEQFQAFESLYPVEAGVIRGINEIQPKLLPVLLQRLESRIMLHKVTKAISQKLPDAVLLAIHDCVLTTPDAASEVRAIMEKELTAITGLIPGVKEEAKSAADELDELSGFAQSLYDDSLRSLHQSQAQLSYADYKMSPPLLGEYASHNGLSNKFNPFSYGRHPVLQRDWNDE